VRREAAPPCSRFEADGGDRVPDHSTKIVHALEPRSNSPLADQVELRRLEQEKARLINLATTTDDDPDIAGEVNDRRKRIAQLQTQLAAARQTPALLKGKLDAAEAHMRGRLADLAGLLADRGEGGRRLYRTLFPEGLHFSPVQVGKRLGLADPGHRLPVFRLRCDPTGNRTRDCAVRGRRPNR
jgi:hypothetical protein